MQNLSALNLLAVGCGAALGAWSRWFLGLALNPLFVALPLGTLAANVIGGYLVVERLLAGQPAWAIGLASIHLAGSLTATYLGLLTVGATRIWS